MVGSTNKPSKSIPFDYLSSDYLEYQKRYESEIRESDRVLVQMVAECVAGSTANVSLIDVGASTGNLLVHLRQAFPEMQLFGCDVLESAVDKARANPALAGVDFSVMDILGDVPDGGFDIAVANAIIHYWEGSDLKRCLSNLAKLLRPGGTLLAFGCVSPHDQTLLIQEISPAHPGGAVLNIHAADVLSEMTGEVGFTTPEFRPFEIPIDLPKPDSMADLISYTRTTDEGKRVIFRGALYQPWTHIRARKVE